jgi:nifR3 family TIM-barrel protein
VRSSISIPLTIKIRAGWDGEQINAVQIARIAQDCGVDAVTVHGRTRMQGFTGRADWRLIAKVKEAVSCTVIGSGDVKTPIDAGRMLEQTSCEGVMIGRAALGNPWLFAQTIEYLESDRCPSPPGLAEKKAVILKHFELFCQYHGLYTALLHMRKHIAWYTHGLPHSATFRRLINTIQDETEFIQAVDDYWDFLQQHQHEYSPYG